MSKQCSCSQLGCWRLIPSGSSILLHLASWHFTRSIWRMQLFWGCMHGDGHIRGGYIMWGLQVDCGTAGRQTPVMVASLRQCLAGLHTAACSSSPPSSRLRPMGGRPARRAVSAAAAAQAAPPAGVPPPGQPPKKRLAVFVSGGGSNFGAIHAAMLEGGVHGEVAVVVSNAPTCGGCQYAQAQGIPTLTFPAPKVDPAAGLSAEQLVQQLTEVRGGGRSAAAAAAASLSVGGQCRAPCGQHGLNLFSHLHASLHLPPSHPPCTARPCRAGV